jgi:quercetin dioxygenase-like cupin family protein
MIVRVGSAPRAIPLAIQEEVSNDSGITDRETMVDGVRRAIVEYSPGARRARWCDTPHTGIVISGTIRYDFDDGREPLIAGAGNGFLLPRQPRHRGTNPGPDVTRLFLIDSVPGG